MSGCPLCAAKARIAELEDICVDLEIEAANLKFPAKYIGRLSGDHFFLVSVLLAHIGERFDREIIPGSLNDGWVAINPLAFDEIKKRLPEVDLSKFSILYRE